MQDINLTKQFWKVFYFLVQKSYDSVNGFPNYRYCPFIYYCYEYMYLVNIFIYSGREPE